MGTAWPTATLVHLPIHASWLNQVEIYFSVLQRKAINPVDFADLDTLADRILAFQDRYNRASTPFDWTFSRTRPPRPARPHRKPHGASTTLRPPHNPRRTCEQDH